MVKSIQASMNGNYGLPALKDRLAPFGELSFQIDLDAAQETVDMGCAVGHSEYAYTVEREKGRCIRRRAALLSGS